MGTQEKRCKDCGTVLTGHGTPSRCQSCAARHRYIKRFGKPPEIIIGNCEVCGKEFQDYACNRKKGKVHFCSHVCRAAWVGVHNSISRGGDGIKKSKSLKDKLYYRKTAEHVRKNATRYYANNRTEILEKLRNKNRALKQEVIDAYGGKCECCGETYLEFLTIDHKNGDGYKHRKAVGKGRKIYEDLKRLGFPKDEFGLLCLNCNISLGFYGYCPHRPEIKRVVNKVPRTPGRKRKVV